jgi:hypothetical protein
MTLWSSSIHYVLAYCAHEQFLLSDTCTVSCRWHMQWFANAAATLTQHNTLSLLVLLLLLRSYVAHVATLVTYI